MTAVGGGGVAAYGLKYQYLVTADYFLRYLRQNPELIPRAVLLVDPLISRPDGTADDIVDFAIEVDGVATHHIQVKASSEPEEHPLRPGDARPVLVRLLGHEARISLILTNKPLSPQLLPEADVIDTGDSRITYVWSAGPQPEEASASEPPLIVVDTRTPSEVRDSIAELIRGFRKDRSLNQGLISARLLVSILLDSIFAAAAGNEPNRITALALLEELAMPDARIAHVAGAFDWGLPISNIPNYISTVPRLAYLEQVQAIVGVDDSARDPARIVLVGQTGNGKSVLASDYCHVDAVRYEFVCWVDCRSVEFIDPQIRNYVAQLTSEAIAPTEAVGPVFAALLGRCRGPWLLVFDGIQNRSNIDEYVPTRGHGSIIVTTNNSLNWWPNVAVIDVGEFTEQEAIDCFASYSGIATDAVESLRKPIADIVSRLGRIPLAVSMAAIYFKNTEGQLSELAPQYFADLEALADDDSIPPGFNKTAFAAIQHAVRSLGQRRPDSPHGKWAQAVLQIGSLLAPELLPLNLMLPATAEEVHTDLANLPMPAEFDPVVRRGVLATLRTQTIARRVVNDGEGGRTPASESVVMHPLVHDILQRSYLAHVPPGQLQAQATVLMAFLLGWLGALRKSGEFFAVEQLRLHANSLLELVARHEPLSAYSPQNDRVYAYAKSLLLAELSTCQASRGRLQEALDLGRAAAQGLSTYAYEKAARFITMKVLSDMVTDLSMGEAPPELVAMFGVPLLAALAEVEADDRRSVRDVAYTIAGELHGQLNRIDAYRDSPLLEMIREQLGQIGARDPDRASREATRLARINELYEAGEFNELRRVVTQWRAENTSSDSVIMLSALEIVAQLHTDAVDEALDGIEKLLDLRPHGDYLLLSLHEAFKKIGRELHRVLDNLEGYRDRLQAVLDKVLARYNELSDAAGGPS